MELAQKKSPLNFSNPLIPKPVIYSVKIPKQLALGFINGDSIWNQLKDNSNNKEIYNKIQETI